MQYTFKKALLLLSLLNLNANVYGFTYTDQKQNCTKYVTNSFCYGEPRFDAVGQYKSCSVPGTMALTFDDGPNNNIPYILDILKLYNMKATFFLIGYNVYKFPQYVQRIVDEGHQIGCHTYTHPYLSDLTLDQLRQEFLNFENAIIQRNYGGILANHTVPTYFRAPHGAVNAEHLPILNEFNLLPIHWSFLNGDSYITNSSEILPLWYEHMDVNGVGVIPSQLTPIIQQHEIQQVTYDSFANVAAYLYNVFGTQGVRFVTIAECLGNIRPPYQVTPRHQEDPTCSTGILINSTYNYVPVTVCCANSCGACGGNGCGNRTGGADGCCVTNIAIANVSCMYSKPPCVVN